MKPILTKSVNVVKGLFKSNIDEIKKDLEEIDRKINEYKNIQISKDLVTPKKIKV